MEIYIKLIISLCILKGPITCQERKRPIDQLPEWRNSHSNLHLDAVNQHGILMPSLTASLSAGSRGPLLLKDTHLIDHLAHFNRERIPERVVHAKGGGAFGYFEVTHDITKWTKASIFSAVGQKTPIAMRFSTVGGEAGSADTLRDPRGFAVKFYSEDGNYDLVGNNIPIFFVRDPILFPSFIHTQKRNPKTHLKDANMFWDFMSLRPETTHQCTFLFSDRGIPDGFRHMHGYGSHTFKLVNQANGGVYVKFHMRTEQGIRNLLARNASRLASMNPDYSIDDLYTAIENGDFPSWKLFIQVMTYEEASVNTYNPFDLTKVWLHSDYPLIPVGRLVLNRNPENYFAEIEQLAFTPANFIPGIESSPDKMLQGRLFAYGDAHKHRLGINFGQTPVNRPIMNEKKLSGHYNRDGFMNFDTESKGAPNYFPNSFCGPTINPKAMDSTFTVNGDVVREDTGDKDNFSQVNLFWTNVLTRVEKERLVTNMASHMRNAMEEIRERAIGNFEKVNEEYGQMLRSAVQKALRML